MGMKESEKIAAFTAGFVGYPLLEIGWRGQKKGADGLL